MLQASYQDELIEAGCDEAGRGCLAGPVVAAAVILPKNFFHPLLNDSKQLTENERELLAPIIKAAAIDWKIGICDNHEIDAINILKASFKAMHKAVDQMKKKPGLLLIDGNRFYKYPRIPHICIVKGDARFMSIAAASVLAKTYRDDLMGINYIRSFPFITGNKTKGIPPKTTEELLPNLAVPTIIEKTFRLLPENEASLFE
jgi:ribonuclease HII